MSNTKAAGQTICLRQVSRTLAILRSLPLLACAFLAACSTPRAPDLHNIDLVVARGANQNTPIAFDIVYVFDQAALARLPRTSAEWFRQPNPPASSLGSPIRAFYYELVPDSTTRIPEPLTHGAIAVVGYANYTDEAGQPMIDLTGYRKVTIRFGPDRIDLSGER
ncbi:hypothetical protein ACSUZJ_15560 [Telluria sp. B2]